MSRERLCFEVKAAPELGDCILIVCGGLGIFFQYVQLPSSEKISKNLEKPLDMVDVMGNNLIYDIILDTSLNVNFSRRTNHVWLFHLHPFNPLWPT